jgi:hypothetical protein
VPDARISQSSVTQHQGALTLSASQITSGTLADARLSSNVPLKNAANTFTSDQVIDSGGITTLYLNSTTHSELAFYSSGQPANNRRWYILNVGTALNIRTYDDSVSSGNVALELTRTGIIPGPIRTYGDLHVGAVHSGVGRIHAIVSPDAAHTGFIEFINSSDSREGYIGYSATTGGNDTGTIPYVAGTHAFTGNITVTGTVSGNGSGLTSLNASNIASGTIADARLSSNVALKNAANTFTDAQTISTGSGTALTVNGQSNLNGYVFLNAGGTTELRISSSSLSELSFYNSSQPVDNKLWILLTNGSDLELRSYNDSAASSNSAITFTRSGLTPTGIHTYSAISVGTNNSGIGYTKIEVGSATNSGYIAFHSPSGTRVGYIGWATAFGTGDNGTLPYVAGMHSFTGRANTVPVSVAFSATPTFNSSLSNIILFGTMTANVTSMTITNAVDGAQLQIRFVQDGTGGRTVTLPSNVQVSGSLNTAANAVTWLVLTYVSSASRWEGTWTRIS